MKILYIGPIYQLDGHGEATRSIIQSILAIPEVDLTIRPIKLANVPTVSEDWMVPLEEKTNDSYDIIIQHSLPELYHWFAGSKNIGFCLTETHHLEFTPWISKLNLMDEIWVSSSTEKDSLENSGSKTPIKVINEATNVEKFKLSYSPPRSNFTFYTIGEGERKNLGALLLAFHREFDRNEPVDLLIKSSIPPDLIAGIKKNLGIYTNVEQYKPEKIVNSVLSDVDLCKLHLECDCFISTSYGEAWCRPALDAMGFGRTPIVTDNTGMTEFVNNENGWVIPSREEPCLSSAKPLPYLYTSRETWFNIDVLALQKAMREAYSNHILRAKKAAQGKKDVQWYSYDRIGRKIKNILGGAA